jgi:hypothetical protein
LILTKTGGRECVSCEESALTDEPAKLIERT